jgi:hypothetical protein
MAVILLVITSSSKNTVTGGLGPYLSLRNSGGGPGGVLEGLLVA